MWQFSDKTDNFDFFSSDLPKRRFWGRNFQRLTPDSNSTLPRYHTCQFSGKRNNFNFFDQNLPKINFGISPESESAPPSFYVCWFLYKAKTFEFFGLDVWKLPKYGQYFGSYKVEGVPESRVEVEMFWVELGGILIIFVY